MTLEKLADLRQALLLQASPDQQANAWDLVMSIESDLDSDARCSDLERGHVRRIRQGVSDVIAAHNQGLNPVLSLALIPIGSLESSLRKRTTGVDGWPLG